jgi:hypothetical protein
MGAKWVQIRVSSGNIAAPRAVSITHSYWLGSTPAIPPGSGSTSPADIASRSVGSRQPSSMPTSAWSASSTCPRTRPAPGGRVRARTIHAHAGAPYLDSGGLRFHRLPRFANSAWLSGIGPFGIAAFRHASSCKLDWNLTGRLDCLVRVGKRRGRRRSVGVGGTRDARCQSRSSGLPVPSSGCARELRAHPAGLVSGFAHAAAIVMNDSSQCSSPLHS